MKNTQTSYGLGSILFHWVNGLMVLALLGVGLFLTTMEKGPAKGELVGMHKSMGALALFVIVARLIWMAMNTSPAPSAALSPAKQKLSKTIHHLLLLLILLFPLSGWIMSSAAGYPVSVFGLFTLPDLVQKSQELAGFMRKTHMWLGYITIATLVLHIGGALYHKIAHNDGVLERIIKPSA